MGWDLKSGRPIYFQLMKQIELRIISGVYPPGGRLPSVRDMAMDASVNPNTMQRALAELENEGLLYSQRTSGRFVTEDGGRIMEMKNKLAKTVIDEFMKHMTQLGYNRQQTISLINQTEEEDN
ncbi:MAG TPA: GntR family transcriptional regulator [Ruminococcaceae bacterium]|mgnify:FL=1|nr:GntR family transcriptional regulator [Oscillospiraceae bacterium]